MKNRFSSGSSVAGCERPGICADKILDALADAVCVVDDQGIFQFAAEPVRLLTGYDPEELIGTALFDFLPLREAVQVRQILLGHSAPCPLRHFESPFITRNGATVLLAWAFKHNNGDGLYYGTVRNADNRQLVEQRLRKTQQLAKVGNYEYDIPSGRYTYASDSVFEIFGLDRKVHPELTIELFWRLVHPEDVQRVRQDLLEMKNMVSSVLEYRIVGFDGRVTTVNRIREVIRDENGRPLTAIGTVQDVTEQRKSEHAARQSEERFRALVENSYDAITVLDKEGRYLFISATAEKHLGLSAVAMIGQSPKPFLHPEDANRIAEAVQRTAPGETTQLSPFRVCDTRGNWHWRESTISNQLHNPLIAGYVFNTRDVTERVEKEAERQQIESRLALQNEMMVDVLEQMQEGFVTITLEGKIIYWNKEAERISGISREAALGKNVWTLYPYDKHTDYYRIYELLLKRPEPFAQKFYLPKHKKWVDLRVYRTQKGISAFFRDVTDEEKAATRLRKLSLLVKQTNNQVAIQDKDRRVRWVNKAFLQQSGYSFQECLGKTISELCDGPGTDPATLQHIADKLSRNEPFHVEALNYRKNGEPYWVDITCQPHFNKRGDVTQYFSIATDITARKNLEMQLAKEQKERQRTVAAATLKAQERERTAVSQELHDNVNQVLTTVKLYAEMCRDGLGNTAEMMNKSIHLLQESITEIRSLSKRLSAPSLGKIKLADSVRELMSAVAATKKLCIHLDTVDIDGLEVDQEVHLAVYRILQEHITNVLKHAAATNVSVKFELLRGQIRFTVADDGKGFDTSKKSNGIGITNMVTRAESLKGCLSMESEPGKGCTLRVQVPF